MSVEEIKTFYFRPLPPWGEGAHWEAMAIYA